MWSVWPASSIPLTSSEDLSRESKRATLYCPSAIIACALDQGTYTEAQGCSYFSGAAAEWPAAEDCVCSGQLPGVKQGISEKRASTLELIFAGQKRLKLLKAKRFVHKQATWFYMCQFKTEGMVSFLLFFLTWGNWGVKKTKVFSGNF